MKRMRGSTLRRTQALAALLWLVYGALMKAPPVIAAFAHGTRLGRGATRSPLPLTGP